MPSLKIEVSPASVTSLLTRASGYLLGVCSHSLQPYRGCGLGRSLCGVGCYVRHNRYVTGGRVWGLFVEARTNAVETYERQYLSERAWGRRERGCFSIFMSSSTEPFQPAEQRYRVTRGVLEAMVLRPPDELIVQSHSHRAADYLDLYQRLSQHCSLRVHLSIESDRDRLPGLPPAASPVHRRMEAAGKLHAAGIRTVVTVAPLLPIARPREFFSALAGLCDGVVIDHFIGGDGSSSGARTRRTPLPAAMEQVEAGSSTLAYREQIIEIARQCLPGRLGIGQSGFAGEFT